MIRFAIWLLAAALLGGIVHIGSILLLPSLAARTSYARLAPMTAANQITLLPQPAPGEMPIPFLDPAFATAVCRYDLSAAPLKLRTQISPTYTSVTFYNRNGVVFYAITDRAAGRRVIELDLMTPQQRSTIQEDEETTAADRLVVESPTTTGLIILRSLAPEPGALPTARGVLASASCGPPKS